MRKAFSRQRRRGMVQLHGRSTFALPLGWLHGIVVSYAKSIQLQQRLRRLTLRSSGPATAGHQARVGGTRYIFTAPGLASHRWSRLTSNVRPHKTQCPVAPTVLPRNCRRSSSNTDERHNEALSPMIASTRVRQKKR